MMEWIRAIGEMAVLVPPFSLNMYVKPLLVLMDSRLFIVWKSIASILDVRSDGGMDEGYW